jgi:hypothetical protein
MWRGGCMSLFTRAAADWAGGGYGPLVLTPALHPGTVATLLPWASGERCRRPPELPSTCRARTAA